VGVLGEKVRSTRASAAVLLARSGAETLVTREVLQKLDDETVVILALSPPLRARLLQAGRISPEPSPTQGRDEIRRRQVVLFACSASLQALQRSIPKWPRTCADLMDDICLALTIRLSRNEEDRAALAGTLEELGLREGGDRALSEAGIWLRLAQHKDLTSGTHRVPAATLSRPLQLALRGAIPDGVRSNVVERILWKRGSHPGLSGLEVHREFVSDLLLAHAAATPSQRDPYVPKGMLAAGNDFVHILTRVFQFLTTREPWGLREYRLSL